MAATGGGGRRSTPPGPSGRKMPGKVGLTNRRFGPTGRPVPVGSGPRYEDGSKRRSMSGGKKRR